MAGNHRQRQEKQVPLEPAETAQPCWHLEFRGRSFVMGKALRLEVEYLDPRSRTNRLYDLGQVT